MSYSRTKVVEQMKSWLGCSEADGSHKKIIDVYNSHTPRARGYKVKYTDEWCATTVSAVSIALGYTEIIPTECSCNNMIKLLQKLGAWDENDARVPLPGDIMFYDWDDKGTGDNSGRVDHVGIVEKVVGNKVTIIEGNYKNGVNRRTLSVNGKYIRGYGVPKYDVDTNTQPEKASDVKMKQIKRGSKGKPVKVWQAILGFSGADIDGVFGPETEKKTVALQKKAFPNDKNEWDGVVGDKTWKAGLESV